VIDSNGKYLLLMTPMRKLSIQGSTGRGHSFASLLGCLGNCQLAIQLLIYIRETDRPTNWYFI